jgi:hypothetical protein
MENQRKRCDGCETFKVKVGAHDFTCRHMTPGYFEPNGEYKRCEVCRKWAEEKGVTSDFWCRHNIHRSQRTRWKVDGYNLISNT